MSTATAFETEATRGSPATMFARYLLTAERVLMGLVLLGFGISGLLTLLPHSCMPDGAAALGGALTQAGFAYPLLKGTEMLLELYVRASLRASKVQAELAPAYRREELRIRRGQPRARRRVRNSYRGDARVVWFQLPSGLNAGLPGRPVHSERVCGNLNGCD